jgi:hypothetical protein
MKAVAPPKSAIGPTKLQAIHYFEEITFCGRKAEADLAKLLGG